MSTSISNRHATNLSGPPPPYTMNIMGPNSLQTGSAERNKNLIIHEQTGKSNNNRKFLTLMQLGSIIVLMLCALSCIIALHRNTKIMEQNLELLERQLQMLDKNKNVAKNSIAKYDRIKRMVEQINECPPCPTEPPPNPIEPHKNPVSVLNEEMGNRANYTTIWVCEDPHIHHATLKIFDDPTFEGKTWEGKGKSMQNAKQAAAWEAIQKDLPHLMEFVADEYKPVLYNPLCKKPHTSF